MRSAVVARRSQSYGSAPSSRLGGVLRRSRRYITDLRNAALAHIRVKRVAQPVSDVVDREDRRKDTETREDRCPPSRLQIRLGVREHVAPRCRRRLDAQTQKRE